MTFFISTDMSNINWLSSNNYLGSSLSNEFFKYLLFFNEPLKLWELRIEPNNLLKASKKFNLVACSFHPPIISLEYILQMNLHRKNSSNYTFEWLFQINFFRLLLQNFTSWELTVPFSLTDDDSFFVYHIKALLAIKKKVNFSLSPYLNIFYQLPISVIYSDSTSWNL